MNPDVSDKGAYMRRMTAVLIRILLTAAMVILAGCGNGKPAVSDRKIGIIGAMDEEVRSLKEAMKVTKKTEIAQMEFCEGTLEGQKAVVVKCGVGKVNAGICVHTLIHEFGCTEIINTGIAGSLDEEIDICDIVVSTDAVQHDFDVSPVGFQKGEIPYTGLAAFPADESLRAMAVKAVQESTEDTKVFEGRVCSGDQFISSDAQKEKILSEFGGMCCEMEGAAIAQACWLSSTPFVIIRCISDKPGGGEEVTDYPLFEAQAAEKCAAVIHAMIRGQ